MQTPGYSPGEFLPRFCSHSGPGSEKEEPVTFPGAHLTQPVDDAYSCCASPYRPTKDLRGQHYAYSVGCSEVSVVEQLTKGGISPGLHNELGVHGDDLANACVVVFKKAL